MKKSTDYMLPFNEKTASADELWDYCMAEYRNQSPIIKRLINRFFAVITSIISKQKGIDSILEVGCGAGESTIRIGKSLHNIYIEASEVDPRYVEKLKDSDFPYPIIQESVYSMKRDNNTFDCVLLLEVLEHLEHVELALSELFRVSKRYVLISVPNEPLWRILNLLRFKYLGDFGNTPGHINHWSKTQLKKLLSPFGKICEIRTSLPWTIIMVEKFIN